MAVLFPIPFISPFLNSLLEGHIDLEKLVDNVQSTQEQRIDDHDAAKPDRSVELDEGVTS